MRQRRGTALLGLLALLLAACIQQAQDPAVPSPAAEVAQGTSPPSAPSSPIPSPSPVPRRFTVAATGDVLPHLPVVRRAREYGAQEGAPFDFAPMLAPVAPVLQTADLALCHLEVPLTRDAGDLSGYPAFNAPAELAGALSTTGYDGCSTASNHSLDRSVAGITATLDALDAAGLRHAGTARSQDEDDAATLYEAGGVSVAQVSGTYGLNGREVPADAPWSVDLLDPAALLAEAARARVEGAEFVIASLHWGAEYQREPTDEQRALAAQLLASPDVDLILGHHAHVVQPVERIGGEVVVYGLGNSLSNQSERAATQDGVLVTVVVEEDLATGAMSAREVRATPTWVERPSFRVLPVPVLLADPATSADLRTALERSLARTTEALGPEASIWAP